MCSRNKEMTFNKGCSTNNERPFRSKGDGNRITCPGVVNHSTICPTQHFGIFRISTNNPFLVPWIVGRFDALPVAVK